MRNILNLMPDTVNKRLFKLISLMIALSMSTSLWGDELIDKKFNGLMLAWTRLPGSNVEETQVVAPKPKPKLKKQTVKPQASKPVPATSVSMPKAVVKPQVVPVAVPKVQPTIKVAPVHVAKSIPVYVEKPAPTYARNEALSFEWLVGMGIDMGGEELGTVTYSDGSTAPVNANTGIVLNVGGVVKNGKNNPFSTQFTIGYKSGGPKFWNKDVNWTVIPLEVIENYQLNRVRFGLGLSYQINPQLKVDLPSSSSISKYNNAIGLVAQIGWTPVREHYSINLRYTAVKFQSSDVPDAPTINGSVSGLYATFYY